MIYISCKNIRIFYEIKHDKFEILKSLKETNQTRSFAAFLDLLMNQFCLIILFL